MGKFTGVGAGLVIKGDNGEAGRGVGMLLPDCS